MEGSRGQEPLVRRDELAASIEARRELGAELEPELVDAFVERIERRIEARYGKPERPRADKGASFVLAIVSLGVGIPLTAIALSTGGLAALVLVWGAIVLVNALYARG